MSDHHADGNVSSMRARIVTEEAMDIFFARTRGGVERFLDIKSKILDAELWVNGGVDLEGIDTHQYAITKFNTSFDMSKDSDRDAALGTIEDHYKDCTIWIEGN
ncbi:MULTISPECIES: hypothetical protein [Paraburkholderia]|nr:hypothetical protein [Paraburkholderia dioscoreae]